ncbi:acyltransferase [Hymenobacter arcticus]
MKQHFETLDGLRGTAALLVVIYHLQAAVFGAYALIPLRHAYLAVDFFFLLSGYVIGYAYDDRWPALRVRDFFRLRLIRLHPLVLLTTVLGALCFYLDPYAPLIQYASPRHMLATLGFGVLLLPFSSLPHRAGETHSLNAPCWSLLQEYLINIVYALAGSRLGPRALAWVVALAASALVATAWSQGGLQGGWSWDTLWVAPIRSAFPFFAGLLLYRRGLRFRLPEAYWVLSGLLLALFAAPAWPYAGLYEAACVIVVFPLMVAAGAGSPVQAGWLRALCRWAGRLSYPLYLVHYPFIYIFTNWVQATRPTVAQATPVMVALTGFFLVLAWGLLRYYDEPVRAWLAARTRPATT